MIDFIGEVEVKFLVGVVDHLGFTGSRTGNEEDQFKRIGIH
jgi:hypothetical protein